MTKYFPVFHVIGVNQNDAIWKLIGIFFRKEFEKGFDEKFDVLGAFLNAGIYELLTDFFFFLNIFVSDVTRILIKFLILTELNFIEKLIFF